MLEDEVSVKLQQLKAKLNSSEIPKNTGEAFLGWYNTNIEPLLAHHAGLQISFDPHITRILNQAHKKPADKVAEVINTHVDEMKKIVDETISRRKVAAPAPADNAESGMPVQGSSRRKSRKLKTAFRRSVAQTRGKTLKRYKKGKRYTQKK